LGGCYFLNKGEDSAGKWCLKELNMEQEEKTLGCQWTIKNKSFPCYMGCSYLFPNGYGDKWMTWFCSSVYTMTNAVSPA
jgi:hypothetical protein